jgi:hypothetical protein
VRSAFYVHVGSYVYPYTHVWYRSRDRVITILSRQWDVQQRNRSSVCRKNKGFLFFEAFSSALGSTQPFLQWVPAALSLWVERPERENEQCRGSVRLGPYLKFCYEFMAFAEAT